MSTSATTSSSPIVKLALVGIVAIGYYFVSEGLSKATLLVTQLPVKGFVTHSAASASVKAPDVGGIHPLLVESSKKAAGMEGVASGPMRTLDALFAHTAREDAKDSTSEVAAPLLNLPQGLSSLRKYMTVQAILDNGAIINGQFFSPGERITTVTYQSTFDRKPRHPFLARVSSDSVFLKESKGSIGTVKVRLP